MDLLWVELSEVTLIPENSYPSCDCTSLEMDSFMASEDERTERRHMPACELTSMRAKTEAASDCGVHPGRGWDWGWGWGLVWVWGRGSGVGYEVLVLGGAGIGI